MPTFSSSLSETSRWEFDSEADSQPNSKKEVKIISKEKQNKLILPNAMAIYVIKLSEEYILKRDIEDKSLSGSLLDKMTQLHDFTWQN